MKPAVSRHVYAERIGQVVDYISDHLSEPLPLASLARKAHFSPFHFHRIFKTLVGEPVHECVRRLRLERAVQMLKYGPKTTLTRLAIECGFASSSDFSRAFKQAYGFAPRHFTAERFEQESKIRQELLVNAGYGFSSPPKVDADRFRVRLVERPQQRLAYSRVVGGYDVERFLAGYERLIQWGRRRGLLPGAQMIGMSQDDPNVTPMNKYRYDHCLVLPATFPLDRELPVRTLPAARYASLHCRGDVDRVGRAWTHLFQVWLPSSGLQPTNAPAMEYYHDDPSPSEWKEFDVDCMVPVKPL